MFCRLVAGGEKGSWQVERSRCYDGFSALYGESSPDTSQVATNDLKHTLYCSLVSSLRNDLYFTSMHAIRDKVAGV